MTTKSKVDKFRIRRGGAHDVAADNGPTHAPMVNDPDTTAVLDSISKEGLTGRQLRLARRVAQKRGLAVESDFDAVRQLRQAGIDPFQRSSVLDLIAPVASQANGQPEQSQLPDSLPRGGIHLPTADRNTAADRRTAEIMQIQRHIASRRRRKLALLMTRLSFFVFLPTFIVGWYFFTMATPMYATNSEIVIQQADSAGAAGLGGLFQGTSMATQQDSIAVQSYLASREAMLRLDHDHGFKAHFSDPMIDQIQRLPENATNEAAFKVYSKQVRISYDPTEGILRMEVVAADPAKSQEFSEALISYAEEQVDQLTSRLRADQMQGARQSYEAAEARRAAALAQWLAIQEQVQQIDPAGETAARTQQIARQESERQRLELVLQSRLNVERPSEVQVQALRDQIANIDRLIAALRSDMTSASDTGDASQASRNTELRAAEENYTFQTLIVQQALTQMEAAQIEANRQVRYLSQSVKPIAPDEATYPRAFENTVLAFLIFSGIYLMISLTASILREQVSA
ncbi:capsule biosynthesis protein [Yoonia sp.]|uniref:capsule biosynthesis protein n=1 Tax=Yoonia sp. TaxID=2212373 RepID=UPI001A01CD96|nr:capsule biosynthesis protein [Yoonia sp.]MBE0413590.1 capsule biosynthesis protein [Yoonia sp.]